MCKLKLYTKYPRTRFTKKTNRGRQTNKFRNGLWITDHNYTEPSKAGQTVTDGRTNIHGCDYKPCGISREMHCHGKTPTGPKQLKLIISKRNHFTPLVGLNWFEELQIEIRTNNRKAQLKTVQSEQV